MMLTLTISAPSGSSCVCPAPSPNQDILSNNRVKSENTDLLEEDLRSIVKAIMGIVSAIFSRVFFFDLLSLFHFLSFENSRRFLLLNREAFQICSLYIIIHKVEVIAIDEECIEGSLW